MDEEEKLMKYYVSMEGNSLIGAICSIHELVGENDLLKNLFLESLFHNLPLGMHQRINKVHQNILNSSEKSGWICGHDNCEKLCISSHELSEKSILKAYANENNEAYVLEADLKENSLRYIWKEKKICSVLTFPGYCGQHDEELFKLLDGSNRSIDLAYVNLQALRALKYFIFENQLNIKLMKGLINEYRQYIDEAMKLNITNISDAKKLYHKLSHKCILCINQVDSALAFYEQLNQSIRQKKYIISYTKISYGKLGWGFSQAIPLGTKKSCDFNFIFKVDINSEPILIHAWNANNPPEERMTKTEIMGRLLLYNKKIVFSDDFLANTCTSLGIMAKFLLPIELEGRDLYLGSECLKELFL